MSKSNLNVTLEFGSYKALQEIHKTSIPKQSRRVLICITSIAFAEKEVSIILVNAIKASLQNRTKMYFLQKPERFVAGK